MDDNKVSRFLSLVLRHEPEKIGITLDNAGWANIDELLRSASEVGYSLDRPRLLKIIEKNDKQRFTLSSDGHCIRAAQGHSLAIDLGIPTSIPPEKLWHGTAKKNIKSIMKEGLKPGRRHKVHLSVDRTVAYHVGQRHGDAVVLNVNTEQMNRDGYLFVKSENNVWLTDLVPTIYLEIDTSYNINL